MADFCKQDSIMMFNKDFRDLAIGDDDRIDTDPEAKSSDRYTVLCEGCYIPGTMLTVVNSDGECMANCSQRHGKEVYGIVGEGYGPRNNVNN